MRIIYSIFIVVYWGSNWFWGIRGRGVIGCWGRVVGEGGGGGNSQKGGEKDNLKNKRVGLDCGIRRRQWNVGCNPLFKRYATACFLRKFSIMPFLNSKILLV